MISIIRDIAALSKEKKNFCVTISENTKFFSINLISAEKRSNFPVKLVKHRYGKLSFATRTDGKRL